MMCDNCFCRSMEKAADHLDKYTCCSGGSPWSALIRAVSYVFNSSKSMNFPCVSKPGPNFLFHGSVALNRDAKSCPHKALFDRSLVFLKGIDGISANMSNPDDLCFIEKALGLHLFDAISHLAALSSLSTHDRIEKIAQSPARRFQVNVEVTEAAATGLNATVSSETIFVGRAESISKFNSCVRPVFASDERNHSPLVLVHGQPGTGKSRLASQHLELLQKEFQEPNAPHVVYRHTIQCRSKDAVRDGLHKMGLALADRLGLGSAASVEDVLGDGGSKPARLKQFLEQNRFVILADDADEDGFEELLHHVPKSRRPCALVVTSQCSTSDLLERAKGAPFVLESQGDIALDVFPSNHALELVTRTCLGDQHADFHIYACPLDHFGGSGPSVSPPAKGPKFQFLWDLRDWLPGVLDGDLGHLPLAVYVFSQWLHEEVLRDSRNPTETKLRWAY
jgi:hypothetical protein